MDIKDLLRRCIRIFYISRKPSDQELQKVAKVTAISMVAIGLLGLIISALLKFI